MNRKLTYKALAAAVAGSDGNISEIVRRLEAQNVRADWHTVKHALEHPAEHFSYALAAAQGEVMRARTEEALAGLNARYLAEKEGVLDAAESALAVAIRNNEPWAIKFILATKGKERGYESTPTVKVDTTEPLNIDFSGFDGTKEFLAAGFVEVGGGDAQGSDGGADSGQ